MLPCKHSNHLYFPMLAKRSWGSTFQGPSHYNCIKSAQICKKSLMCMLWFNFILGSNFIFLCFKLIIIYYKTQKQKKIKFEPRITLNHNNYEPRAQIKQMFQEGELKQEIKRQSRSFLQNTLFQKRLLQILISILLILKCRK